jgi:hypothetical protein
MARKTTMMPMVNGGTSDTGRRVVTALAMLVLLALVLRDPVGAAVAVEQVAAWGTTALDRLAQFVSALSR